MNGPTLFDLDGTGRTDVRREFNRQLAAMPNARRTDPSTSHTAAECVKPGSRPLVEAIRWWISKQSEPKTAFQIADAIAGYRWQPDTVRTCVSRAGLHAVDNEGRTPGNRRCLRYVLKEEA